MCVRFKCHHPQPPSPHLSPDFIFLIKPGTGLWGFRNTMHGGAICSVLDQTMNLYAGPHRKRVSGVGGNLHKVTFASLSAFQRQSMYVECWMEYRDRRKWMIKGCMKYTRGMVLAGGQGLWVLTRTVKIPRL
jgi:hypothetical protein